MLTFLLLLSATLPDEALEKVKRSGRFIAALDCARTAARRAALDRPDITAIPPEALNLCATEHDLAARDLTTQSSDADPTSADHYVGAKMRQVVRLDLISRLEAGIAVQPAADRGLPLAAAGKRYLHCMRLAIEQYMDAADPGQDWRTETAGMSAEQFHHHFVVTGMVACPTSTRSYQSAFDRQFPGNQYKAGAAWSIDSMEEKATQPYVEMATGVRETTPR